MNNKYDYIQKNLPIKYSEINRLWIYEGSEEIEWTPFAGKYLNRAPKAILADLIYLQKVVQVNKGILSALEGRYKIYDPTKVYAEGDVVYKDGYFYVSLTDNNTRDVENLDGWFKFRMKLKEFYMEDSITGKTHKITLQNGELKIEEAE